MDIDEFINRSNKLEKLKQHIEQMLQDVHVEDTVVFGIAHKNEDDSGFCKLAAHGDLIGVEHVILTLSGDSKINLIELGVKQMFNTRKNFHKTRIDL